MSAQASVKQESIAPRNLGVAPGANPPHAQAKASVKTWIDREALRDVAPILVSIAPFAIVIGVGLSKLEILHPMGVVASGLIYAGSAQLAAMNLLAEGAAPVTVLLTVATINARMLMYGAALESSFRDQPSWFRWIAPQFIVDQTYALAANRSELARDRRRFRRYWLTMGGAIGVVWLGTIGTTLALGPFATPESPINFAATALFIAMLVPMLDKRRAVVGAGGAAIVAGLASSLPNGLGLLAGVMAGMVLGAITHRRTS
jgi:predicted branched-subunit amino acid permease